VFVVRLLKRAKSNTVVLTGLSGSGKTVLFYQVFAPNHNHSLVCGLVWFGLVILKIRKKLGFALGEED